MSVISSTITINEEIGRRLGEDYTTQEDVYITDINQCTLDVQNSYPKAGFLNVSSALSLVAGTAEYALGTDVAKIYGITIPSQNVKLTYLPPEQFDALDPDPTNTGIPTIYTIIGGGSVLRVLPVPSTALTATQRYQKILGSVSASSSIPPLPARYNELYCLYGEMKGLRRQGRYTEADNIESKYENLKARMIDDFENMTAEATVIRQSRDFQGAYSDYGDPIKNIYGNRQ